MNRAEMQMFCQKRLRIEPSASVPHGSGRARRGRKIGAALLARAIISEIRARAERCQQADRPLPGAVLS